MAITTEAELRDLIGGPTELVASKIADRLNDLTRQFIERSPFVCIATGRPGGGLDVSPVVLILLLIFIQNLLTEYWPR